MNNDSWQIPVHPTGFITVKYYQSLASTNQAASESAKKQAAEWTVIVANEQTAGKGRYDRRWLSPAGLGLWFSVILRPRIRLEYLNLLNLSTALIIRDFIAEKLKQSAAGTTDTVRVKWPNDVTVNGKKICGILMESEIYQRHLNHLIVGIGLNVRHTLPDFPEDLRKSAISLQILTGQEWNLTALLNDFLQRYYTRLSSDIQQLFSGVVSRYQEHLTLKGENVRLDLGRKSLEGILVGIDEYGQLILRVAGRQQIVTSGELWKITEETER